MVLSPVATAQTHALCYALIDESLRTCEHRHGQTIRSGDTVRVGQRRAECALLWPCLGMVLSPVATAQTHALCYALIDESLRT